MRDPNVYYQIIFLTFSEVVPKLHPKYGDGADSSAILLAGSMRDDSLDTFQILVLIMPGNIYNYLYKYIEVYNNNKDNSNNNSNTNTNNNNNDNNYNTNDNNNNTYDNKHNN